MVCEADVILGTDGSAPMAFDYFHAMGGSILHRPDRVLLSRDHYAPPTSPSTLGFHSRMATYAQGYGFELLEVGAGIGFLVALERGMVHPGDLVVGADSHTITCGSVGAFATGIGSADLAGALLTGRVWLRVPDTMRVVLDGALPTGVGAKDVALEVVRIIGSNGATYAALEFVGPVAEALPLDERMVVSNMSAETGAKAGIFPTEDPCTDANARVAREVRVDCASLEPQVALPHDPANGVPVTQVEGTAIDWVFLGTCTGGRPHDFREALRMLDAGGGIAEGVVLVVAPPTATVRGVLERDGTLSRLASHGAVITETGCGPCCGTSEPIPRANARIISTANRNFLARMGEPTAEIHLASPATCAAAASAGRIIDPRRLSNREAP